MGRVCLVLRPVVTLQSFKVIGRPKVRELGRSLVFAPNVLVSQVAPLVKWTFFGPKLILTISGRPNRFNGSISTSLVNLNKIGQGHIFALSRDLVT